MMFENMNKKNKKGISYMRHKENLHFCKFANLHEKSSKRSGGPKRIWLIIIKSHIENCNICEQLDY